jgi:CRISPR-associated protein Csb2
VDVIEWRRGPKARTMPSASLIEPSVTYTWPSAPEPPRDVIGPLGALLSAASSVGHSCSLVAADVTDAAQRYPHVLKPDSDGAERLRVPYPGRLTELVNRYERFRKDPVKVHRPGAGKTELYSRVDALGVATARQGVFSEIHILRRVRGDRMPLTGALLLTQALRGAAMQLAPQPCPEYISGHSGSAEAPRRAETPHVGFVPVAFVGSEHATGQILGAAMLLPRTLTGDERRICLRTLRGVRKLAMGRAGTWEVEPVTGETAVFNLRPETWTKASRRWASVTPYVFDRFPKGREGEEAERIVRESCLRAGLPMPAEISLGPVSPLTGTPHAAHFPPAPARPGKPRRYHIHVVLHFETPVKGPVALGAGRFYGYGLFRPCGG